MRTSILVKIGWKLNKRSLAICKKKKEQTKAWRLVFPCLLFLHKLKVLTKNYFSEIKSALFCSNVLKTKPLQFDVYSQAALRVGVLPGRNFSALLQVVIPAVSPSPFTLAVSLLSLHGRMAHGDKAADLPYGKVINFLLHFTFSCGVESLMLQEPSSVPWRIRLAQPRQGGREMTSGKCSLLKLTWWQHGAVPSAICTSDLCMYKLAKNFNTLRRVNSASSLGNVELTVNHVDGFAILTLTRGCHCLFLHHLFWMKFCLSATNKWLSGWKKNYPKVEKPKLSTGLNEGWRKGSPQGAEESLDACPWTQATWFTKICLLCQ